MSVDDVLSVVVPPMHAAGARRHFEDFERGAQFALGTFSLTRDEIVAFARAYDPQAFHLDDAAAQQTLFRGLAASGWHVCASIMRQLNDRLLAGTCYKGLLAIEEIKWLLPARPYEAFSVVATCTNARCDVASDDFGIATLCCEAFNSDKKRVAWWQAQLAVGHRGRRAICAAASASPSAASTATRRPLPHGLQFFEDVEIGHELFLGRTAISTEDIIGFRDAFDPCRTHGLDSVSGRATASYWHIASLWTRSLVEYYACEAGWLRARQQDVPELGPSPGVRRFVMHRPVCGEDVLSFTTWAERKLNLPARYGWGLLVGGAEIRNQREELVASFFVDLLLQCRGRGPNTKTAEITGVSNA